MTIHDDLERDEGRRTKVYKCTADKNTIGKGRNLDDVPLTAEEEAHLGCTTADLLAGKALDNAQIDYRFENDLRIHAMQLDTPGISLTWASSPGRIYRIMASEDLSGFEIPCAADIPSTGGTNTQTFDLPEVLSGAPRAFFRVEEQ